MTGPTLADIMALSEDNEVKRTLLNQGIGTDYDIFCESVEDAILEGIARMEAMKPQFASLGEDPLTGILAFGLQMKGFSADHDNYRNGHCDLVVKSGRYEWYGEAKLDKGPHYVLEGFRQLCDRYAPGGGFTCRGGLIIYTSKRNKLRILDVWAKRIKQSFGIPTDFSPICKVTLTAKSSHVHPATGLDFKVRHFPISFYHRPTDKSAKARKGKKTS